MLERRALENYFPLRAVQTIKGDKYLALEPYERLSDLDLAWAKSENWRIAGEVTKAEIGETDLGVFLASLKK